MNPDPASQLAQQRTTLDGLSPRVVLALQIAGAAALLIGFALGLARQDRLQYFFHAYLTSYCYVLGMVLGSLLMVLLLHVSRAGWGVAVRRLAEVLGVNIPLMLILFVPIVLPLLWGNSSLYEWASPQAVEHDELLQHKAPYLNAAFFAVRAAGYFLVWWLIARFFVEKSIEQDGSGNPQLTVRMERASGPAILLLGLTVTFASFDWLMSLDPRWTSTIYGVYYYSGAVVGAVSLWILLAMALQASGRLTGVITVEHYHDLGKLLFASVVFWGYIAFSQYLLIWYANIPEETTWYRDRQTGPWLYVSLALVIGHLLVPFFGLLSRGAKRCKPVLAFWAVWMLVFHWIDVSWLVMPRLAQTGFPWGPIDVCLLVSLGCMYLAGVFRLAMDRPLVPLKDPRLAESLAFENF
jgi:hypothetical protein